jgi:hypothetical protein
MKEKSYLVKRKSPGCSEEFGMRTRRSGRRQAGMELEAFTGNFSIFLTPKEKPKITEIKQNLRSNNKNQKHEGKPPATKPTQLRKNTRGAKRVKIQSPILVQSPEIPRTPSPPADFRQIFYEP